MIKAGMLVTGGGCLANAGAAINNARETALRYGTCAEHSVGVIARIGVIARLDRAIQ
jgi:hypothetical protein